MAFVFFARLVCLRSSKPNTEEKSSGVQSPVSGGGSQVPEHVNTSRFPSKGSKSESQETLDSGPNLGGSNPRSVPGVSTPPFIFRGGLFLFPWLSHAGQR